MVFSSALFVFYFLPVFLLAYLATPPAYRNWTALAGSLAFYTWGAPIFVFVLIASSLADYYFARQIAQLYDSRQRRHWLGASIVLNLGLLGYFKYANFFVENVNELLATLGLEPMKWMAVALPVGISFFTFQKLSYVVDVYQRRMPALQHPVDVLLYIALFPQLIAGPIVRYHEIAEQLHHRRQNYHLDYRINGFFRFTIGLAKKLFIADVLGEAVQNGFQPDAVGVLSTPEAWIILIAYAFQIYFDFSAYSDMAIGLGKLMGFDFPENFNFPYISGSITEFWRRWHLTLSNWMRDYLYIPLGGNRRGASRTYFNLWMVFLLSGLWHGAAWAFVLWGAYHGLFLALERLFLGRWLEAAGKWISIPFTFLVVLMGWVFFRAESVELARAYYEALFSWRGGGWSFSSQFWFFFSLAAVISFAPALGGASYRLDSVYSSSTAPAILAKGAGSMVILVLCFSEVAVSGFHPFIYFRF